MVDICRLRVPSTFVEATSTLIRFRSVFVLFSVHKGIEDNAVFTQNNTKTVVLSGLKVRFMEIRST